jgi:hypothetical protein
VTILAAEAAPARVGAAPAAPTRPLPAAGRAPTAAGSGKPRQGTPGPAGRPGPRGQQGRPSRQRQQRRQLRSPVRVTSRSRGGGNYQPVILAEFVAAVLLVALTPIATKKDTQGLSPYAGTDMIKLAALTVIYLILALLSVKPGPGRAAAWFGGLILLTVGLGEGANIAKVLDIFGTGKDTEAAASG